MTSSYPLPSIAGFETGATWPTASEYFKYVSIDATTTRASTVMRSMPTSDTRTHASMTIPLSRTRSRTSMRLVPPAARSTGIEHSLFQRCRAAPHQRLQLTLERPYLLLQFFVLGRQSLLPRRQVVIELPPVETDLLGFVDGADEQPDPNGQELDFGQRNLDIASHHEPLVEHAVQHIDEARRPSVPVTQWRWHRLRILLSAREKSGEPGYLSNGGATHVHAEFVTEPSDAASKPDN